MKQGFDSADASDAASIAAAREQIRQRGGPPGPMFDAAPVAAYICRQFGVQDLSQVNPFGTRTEAWELMKPTTLGIEVGTVIQKGAAAPQGGGLPYDPIVVTMKGVAPKDQKTVCFFNESSTRSRYLDSAQPKEPFVHPVKKEPMKHDLSRVCVYSALSRHVVSTLPVNMATRLNFIPVGIDLDGAASKVDEIYEAAGGIGGAFASYGPTADASGATVEKVAISDTASPLVNELFYSTMALIDDSNLMNGIIHLPPDVCTAAKLPIYTGIAPTPSEDFLVDSMQAMNIDDTPKAREEVTKKVQAQWATAVADKKKVSHFVAVPINHIVAWPLRSEDYMAQHEMRAEQLRFKLPNKEPVLLYFLVRNVDFDDMVDQLRRNWYGKVDMRPLNSIALEIIPELNEGRYPQIPDHVEQIPGIFAVRSYIKFVSPPVLDPVNAKKIIAGLAPTLMPGFPECRLWSDEARAKEMAIQRHLQK